MRKPNWVGVGGGSEGPGPACFSHLQDPGLSPWHHEGLTHKPACVVKFLHLLCKRPPLGHPCSLEVYFPTAWSTLGKVDLGKRPVQALPLGLETFEQGRVRWARRGTMGFNGLHGRLTPWELCSWRLATDGYPKAWRPWQGLLLLAGRGLQGWWVRSFDVGLLLPRL